MTKLLAMKTPKGLFAIEVPDDLAVIESFEHLRQIVSGKPLLRCSAELRDPEVGLVRVFEPCEGSL